MNCDEVMSTLFLFFDNELKDELLEPFRDHVVGCKDCAQRMDRTRKLLLQLRWLVDPHIRETLTRFAAASVYPAALQIPDLEARTAKRTLASDLESAKKDDRENQESNLLSPRCVAYVDDEIIKLVQADPTLLHRISPRKFEEIIADLLAGFGYEVELTSATRDGGKDIIALRTEHGIRTKLLVECKRYSPPTKVGVGIVRQVYAVKQIERASQALIVTTSYFTKEALKIERQYGDEIALKDYEAILRWIDEYLKFIRRL